MEIYAPKYYLDFKCKASNCKHSCCIGWEIDVDKKSLENYANLKGLYKEEILKSIEHNPTPHFKLLKDKKCPHLDPKGLCKIISNFGEDCLCDICREHPRFYNYTPLGLEVGLGLSCEESCRIILSSPFYDEFIKVGLTSEDAEDFEFNPLPIRDKIFAVLKDEKLSYKQKLVILSTEFSVNLKELSDCDWKDVLSSLEYLDESHKELFLNYSSTASNTPENLEIYLERALAYFVFRHLPKAQSECEIKSYLGLCLFLERLLCSVLRAKKAFSLNEIIPLATTLSEEIEYNEDNVENILFQFI